MAKSPTKSRKPKSATRVCPVSGLEIAYSGAGRPKVFHDTVSAVARREYRAGLGK